MVRSTKPGWLPLIFLSALFFGALLFVHANIASLLGREVADLGVLLVFFGILTLWVNR